MNWNDVWKYQMLTLRRSVALQTEFWDNVARQKSEDMRSMAALTDKQLEKIRLDAEDTLLEIGPGDGRLTIPLAKIAKAVTVVEPSRKMLAILRKNIRIRGVHNTRYVNKRWEEIEVEKDVAKHNIVLASFSLLVADLKAALEKIDLAATRAAYIFLSAESWIPEDLQWLIFGETFTVLSDHIIAYNLLHSIGITANVEIMEYEMEKCFDTFDKAVKEFVESYAVPNSKTSLVKDYLKNALVKGPNGFWYKRRKKAAVIWWTK